MINPLAATGVDSNRQFRLHANLFCEVVKLLEAMGWNVADITSVLVRGETDEQVELNEAMDWMNRYYYFTTAPQEYLEYGSIGVKSELVIDEGKHQYVFYKDVPILNPNLIIHTSGGFIDVEAIHEVDYDGGHLTMRLRGNTK